MILGLIIWFLLTIFLFWSIDLQMYSRGYNGWRRFSSTFLLGFSQILLTQFILGMSGFLTSNALILLNLIISSIILYPILGRQNKLSLVKYRTSITRAFKKSLISLRGDYLYQALLLIAGVVIGWIALLGLLFPVTDVDGNSYHMTFIANAIQNHNLYDVETSLSWLNGYPKGGELIQMWNIIIPHNDLLADLAQLPFVILGIVSLYVIARRVGVSLTSARFVSLLYLFIPVLINQSKTTYVDVILTSLFFAAIALTTQNKLKRIDFVLIGIVFGMLISIKSTGLLFVLATLPLLLSSIHAFNKEFLVRGYKKHIKNLLILSVPVLIGGFWYIKNLILYNTPLYPFGLKIHGWSIFPGQNFQDFIASAFSNFSVMPDGMIARLWFVWTEQKDWFGCLYNYDATFSGLGPVWFVLLLPSLIVGVLYAVKSKNYLFLSICFLLIALLVIYPANYYSRYTIFIVAPGILALGLILDTVKGHTRKLLRLVAVYLTLIVVATTFTLCNFPPSLIREQAIDFKFRNQRGGTAYQNTVGPAYIFIQSHVKAGDTVVYDSKPYYIYPLWKSDFSNKVIYIKSKDKSDWHTQVKNNNVKYVFTTKSSKEHGWAKSNERYQSVYKDLLYEIYEVN